MALPDWLEPMAATLTQDRFATPDWIFERKFDGIRVIAFKRGTDVRLYSRNRLPWHLPAIADAIAALPIADAILDGEVTSGTVYHVFDAMWLDGRDITALPLEERRALLAALDLRPPLEHVRLLEHEQPWELARAKGWEGVIAKRKGTPYEHKRSKHWLKMKCELTQDFVVGGFTDPRASASASARCSSGSTRTTTSCLRARSAPDSTPGFCWSCAPSSTRSRSRSGHSRSSSACRACARTGCVPRSSSRSVSSSGPRTGSFAILVC